MEKKPVDFKLVPALILDLDGTVRFNENGRFINHPDDISLYKGMEKLLWSYKDRGFQIFGLTNQGGVAYGYKTTQGNEAELARMVSLFDRNPFDAIYASYKHEKGTLWPYNVRSLLRKPDIGMLALMEAGAWDSGFVIDWGNSLFVGDRDEDYQCARRAKVPFQWAWEFRGDDPPDNWAPPDPDQGEGYFGQQNE